MVQIKLPLPLLFLLVSFASVGAVLFTPSLPAIAEHFQVSVGAVQFTITSYLIGYAVGQLPYGPLANGIGRKKTLYLGIVVSILGALACALAAPLHSFGLLIVARFIQAFGACVGLKISFTMIADVYDQTDATKMISKTLMAFAIIPGIAIAIGGALTEYLNWQSCFYFLALFGCVTLWLARALPETAKVIDPAALKLHEIVQGYRLKLKNKQLLISGVVMGLGTSVVYVFAAKSPFIGITLIGASPEVFGLFNLIPSAGLVAGSLIAARLASRYAPIQLLGVGVIACLAATLTMLIPFVLATPTIFSLFLPMIFIYAAESIIFANISSLGLASAKNKSNASAVINFINMGVAVISVFLAELILPENPIVMPIAFILFFFVMLLLYYRLK